jgi:hypothetical protein
LVESSLGVKGVGGWVEGMLRRKRKKRKTKGRKRRRRKSNWS